MSVNIFGGGRNTAASGSHASVGNVGSDRNFNQRLILLSNKLAQKVNKSGDTMNGDLKLTFNPDSSNLSLSLGVDGMDRNHSMALLLGNELNQIHHANGAPIALIAQYGFKFKCSEGRTTLFDHDIELSDKHITGLIDPVSASGAVTKQYSDSKLALAVNELIRKIYLNTASLSNLQTDLISRIEAQSSAAASVNSIQDGKIQEMLGKIELNVSGLVSLRRETTELLNTHKTSIDATHEQDMSNVRDRQQEIMNNISTANSRNGEKIAEMLGKIELNESGLVRLRRETTELVNTTRTDIEADHEQKMTTVRGRQQEIINNITSTQRSLNLLRTRHSELKVVVDANKIITDDLVARLNTTRFVKNNVGLIPRLTSNTNKEFIITASHNANDAYKVFNSTPGYFWNPGVAVDEGRYVPPVWIQIKLPIATRIHKIGLKVRSDSERIKSWLLKAKNEDGIVRTIYNPNVHNDRAEDRYIGATVKYFDIPLSLALNYLYYSLEIAVVDSRISNLTYFQIYSLDEVIEMPISSDGSYINV